MGAQFNKGVAERSEGVKSSLDPVAIVERFPMGILISFLFGHGFCQEHVTLQP
jgi:hypothetical protein